MGILRIRIKLKSQEITEISFDWGDYVDPHLEMVLPLWALDILFFFTLITLYSDYLSVLCTLFMPQMCLSLES